MSNPDRTLFGTSYERAQQAFYQALGAGPTPAQQPAQLHDQHFRPVNANEQRFVREAEAQQK